MSVCFIVVFPLCDYVVSVLLPCTHAFDLCNMASVLTYCQTKYLHTPVILCLNCLVVAAAHCPRETRYFLFKPNPSKCQSENTWATVTLYLMWWTDASLTNRLLKHTTKYLTNYGNPPAAPALRYWKSQYVCITSVPFPPSWHVHGPLPDAVPCPGHPWLSGLPWHGPSHAAYDRHGCHDGSEWGSHDGAQSGNDGWNDDA